MVHYNTTNASAVKMAYLYGEMGINNNKFMLRLDNPELLHIDPFSENLTDFEKAMIVKEIVNNPWYYFREIVRIPAGGGLVRFEFHRGTVALIWAVLNDISAFVVWPRQAYKTVTMTCIYSHLFYWGSIHNKIVFIAHEDGIVKKNLQGVKDIRDNLPTWLNMLEKCDRDNEKEMYNVSTNNRITCRAPARNADGARKAGRGLTTPAQWFDEVAFVNYIADMYDSISFAYSQASKSARENGSPYHQIMTTTAGFLNTDEGKWAFNFLNSCADFSERFYDDDIAIVKNIIANSSQSGFLDLSFMYYDLGKDENYLNDQKRRLVTSLTPEDTLAREVLNQWKDISTDHPLGQDRVEKLKGFIRRPNDYVFINDTYSLRLYVDSNTFDFSKPLAGGMDLGGNLKGDFSTLVIVDPEDFSVIAVMRTNSQSTTLFSLGIVSIMTELFPNLVLFPERNYNGAIIDNIVSFLPGGTRRVYHEAEDKPGLFNSKKVRPILFNQILRSGVDDYMDRIHDKTIITEIEGLIRTRNGRIDHKPGNHDDTLMAWLLALYFLLFVEDVGKYFDKSRIGSKFTRNDKIGGLVKQSDNRISDKKLKMIMGAQYVNVMNNSDKVKSMDDIAEIMYGSSIHANKIVTSIEKYSSDDDVPDGFDDTDNLQDVRDGLKRLKKADTATVSEVFVDVNNYDRSQDFKSVFGW